MSMPPDEPPPGGWPAPKGWQSSPGLSPPPTGAGSWPEPGTGPPAGGPGLNLPPGWGERPLTAPQPGVIPLRPLGLDDFFSGTFRTIRSHWRPMLVVSSLVGAVVAVLSVPVAINAHDVVLAFLETTTLDASTSEAELQAAFELLVDASLAFLPWLVYAAILGFAAIVFVDAGVSLVVSRATLGQSTSARTAVGALARQVIRLTALALLTSLSTLVGYLLCIIPGFLLSLMLFAAPSVAMLEDASSGTSYKRSLHLTSKSFWRVIGILLLIQLLFGLAMQVVSSPFSFLAGFGSLGSATSSDVSSYSVEVLIFAYLALWILSVLCYPIVSVGKTLLYIDQRMRHEALSDTLIAAADSRSGSQQ